jgi:uncharacterized protein Yka (UPF0111/DUF47 family)
MEDLNRLLKEASKAVERDIKHIFLEVMKGKLAPTSSRDLVSYVKLLSDVLDKQKEVEKGLSSIPEEDLKQMAKDLLKK